MTGNATETCNGVTSYQKDEHRQRGDLDGLRECQPELAHIVDEADAASQLSDGTL